MERKLSPAAQAVSRDEWLDITTELVGEFEEARDSWFDQVAEFSASVSEQEGAVTYDVSEVFPDQDAEDAMRGYQLFVSLTLIATNHYIEEELFEDFADILCAQVCGSDYFECMEQYNRFTETDDPEAWKRFLGDIVSPSIGNPAGEDGAAPDRSELVREMTPLLSIMTMMVTARSFGDDARVEEYTAMFDNYIGPPEGES